MTLIFFIFSIVEKISVSDLSVDYYVGNLHKWAFACKGTGFLWVDPEHQKHIRPLSTCQTHNMKFPREFQSLGQGCNDICTKYIAASDALDFYKRYSFVIWKIEFFLKCTPSMTSYETSKYIILQNWWTLCNF